MLRFLRAPLLAMLAVSGTLAGLPALAACPPPAPTLQNIQPDDLRRDVRDRGLLWRLEKDGRASWLYGTVHVSRVEWLVPGPRIQAALVGSDVLALELDPADPEIRRQFGARHDPARQARVTAGLQARIASLAAQACLPAEQAGAVRPMLLLALLSLAESRREGLHPEFGVDAVLWGMATRLGKEVVALETAAAQVAALTPASEDDERELVASALDDLEAGSSRAILQRMLQAWAGGDEQLLASYPQWCQCLDTPAERRFFRQLNDDRNPGIADKLDALHAGGQRVFAAVGALHMTGPNALPDLLRQRGYRVERISF